jgi:hypothetical protein
MNKDAPSTTCNSSMIRFYENAVLFGSLSKLVGGGDKRSKQKKAN